ncbi:membrane protein insertion efficiency factor YidD [Victivallis vadensis]|uniref:membrane protein insertion efficiency factor YidD n=1 Tax=Victivallis vadensis TaxID=172901 RepID=UPI003AF8E91A
MLIAIIRVYQWTISPLLPNCCRFEPTCSCYAVEALRIHGFWRGAGLTIWRLLRCQPFCRGGLDPVPPPRKKCERPAEHPDARR